MYGKNDILYIYIYVPTCMVKTAYLYICPHMYGKNDILYIYICPHMYGKNGIYIYMSPHVW